MSSPGDGGLAWKVVGRVGERSGWALSTFEGRGGRCVDGLDRRRVSLQTKMTKKGSKKTMAFQIEYLDCV